MSMNERYLSIIGVLIVGPAVGCIYGVAYGCLTIGCGLFGIALLSRMFTLANGGDEPDDHRDEDSEESEGDR